ncbi:Cadherin prodomain like-protein [Metarhizium guizhouense ARSEF 977]|uniref:Cadherin prodomain like-protein n=1 Tax=Metarhizium guizhouense (strain ARSEF 977) TaxID=1276136 RepID=A0A0B4GV47_METGA|nr:Cadherin prodomain like-protein [Metarhizium guizhouense ARSEF 977]
MSSNKDTLNATESEDRDFLIITENLRRAIRETSLRSTIMPNEEFERRLSEMVSHGTIPPTHAPSSTVQGAIQGQPEEDMFRVDPSRMVSRGKIPPMPRPPLSMILSGPTIPCPPPSTVQGAVHGSNQGQSDESRPRASPSTVQGAIQGQPEEDMFRVDPSRMVSRGKLPPRLLPATSMLSFGPPSARRALPPTVQEEVPGPQEAARRPGPRPLQGLAPRPLQGQGPAPQPPQPPQVPAPQPPQTQNAQRPQQKRARGRRSRGANRGGVQKSGQQGTSSSARELEARMERDPEFLRQVEELALRKEQETSRAAVERAKKATICGNCLQAGHTVRDCVHPADDGFVHGCPICNGSDHESAQGCKMDWPHRLERRLYWAIEQRARRPTLAAFSNWVDIFTEARNAGNVALPQSFPWGPIFCRSLMTFPVYPWSDFDYVANNSSALPVDPTTANQAAVIANDELIRTQLWSLVIGNTGGRPWDPENWNEDHGSMTYTDEEEDGEIRRAF